MIDISGLRLTLCINRALTNDNTKLINAKSMRILYISNYLNIVLYVDRVSIAIRENYTFIILKT